MRIFALQVFSMLRRHAVRVRHRRNQVLAVRLLDSLPPALRKDIGWPDQEFGGQLNFSGSATPARLRAKMPDAGRQRRPAAAAEIVLLPAPATRPFGSISPTRKSPVSS